MTRFEKVALALTLLQVALQVLSFRRLVLIEWRTVFVLLRSRAGVAIRLQLFGFHAHVAELSKVLIEGRDC
jgi:hypothetical protein